MRRRTQFYLQFESNASDHNGIEKGVKLGLRRTLCGYELRSRVNGCVGSGFNGPDTWQSDWAVFLVHGVARGEEGGWLVACLSWAVCGNGWPAGLFAGQAGMSGGPESRQLSRA
jgi:hypothetical protein